MLFMNIEYNKKILFVRLDGKLIRKNTYKINNYLKEVIIKHRIKYLVFNLEQLEEIDTSGVDALLNIKYAIKKNQGKMLICKTPKNIERNIRKLRINSIKNEALAVQSIHI